MIQVIASLITPASSSRRKILLIFLWDSLLNLDLHWEGFVQWTHLARFCASVLTSSLASCAYLYLDWNYFFKVFFAYCSPTLWSFLDSPFFVCFYLFPPSSWYLTQSMFNKCLLNKCNGGFSKRECSAHVTQSLSKWPFVSLPVHCNDNSWHQQST